MEPKIRNMQLNADGVVGIYVVHTALTFFPTPLFTIWHNATVC